MMKVKKYDEFVNEAKSHKLEIPKARYGKNNIPVYILDGNDETGYVLLQNYGQTKKSVLDAQRQIKAGEPVDDILTPYLIYTKPGEWKNIKTGRRLRTCYWHGQDAYILYVDEYKYYTLLVGNYTETEAMKVKRLFDADSPAIERYSDDIVSVESEEFEEQQ